MILKDSLEKKLVEINEALDVHAKDFGSVGLLTGLPGVILFKLYYAQYCDEEQYAEEAYELIQECFEKFHTHQLLLTYCDGVAGFGWVMEHLVENDFLDADNDMLFSDLDTVLYDQMVKNLEERNYDFFHGAMGYAIYFLSRYKGTTNTEFKKKYTDYLHYYIDKMIEISVLDEKGYRKWISVVDVNDPKEVYNLSLSHGIASVLGFFTRLAQQDEFQSKSEPIVKDIIDYLLSTENKDLICFFPGYIYKDGKADAISRLAWCYGDLGIGLQLLRASDYLKDDDLKEKAITVLKASTERKSSEETYVVDASICHGSFGIAQIYRKLFIELKDPIFKTTADFWLQDGLERAFHEEGFAGYSQRQQDHWENQIGLLEGVSGIGLVIIDYLSEETHTWDEAFMIS